ncbi:ABC transporter ATP-binding protein [Vagococcus salmoninarum]|uniref:Spermidine/putrescine ABC transporter ATP-binding protein n=1 Tax=Vagococcus salmoninarum TaxID=2739 RepID=A0A429ZNE8_9ENTE|nr:ATP-binding cassette domain-containing protein [Vagococcus salmoninarum]RST95215.1 spermidine/putrescine ABC transporter ATP-binding protein [Vagococcus salmoninarum]
MSVLTIQDVSFSIDQQTILQPLSLEIATGEVITLVGPSGSGKSTLLKIIASLLTPSTGSILFNNQDISMLDPVNYRKEVSYCFQQPSLFGETVSDNLNFPFEIRKKALDETLIQSYLKQVDLPASFLSKKITELSGGEKQRIALIRNLLFPPQVLLLDEVTTGLDTDSKEIVQQLLKNSAEAGTTLIQVTHDESEIAQAHRLITIDKGGLLHD